VWYYYKKAKNFHNFLAFFTFIQFISHGLR
jgi:hypothetical protein